MSNYETMTVGEIVRQKYGLAAIFEKHHIDYCCGGNIKLSDAVAQLAISLAKIVAELNAVSDEGDYLHFNFNDWSLELLCDYVLKYHHPRIREQGLVIKLQLDKVVIAHGKNYPALLEVKTLFDRALMDLENHLAKEEMILFPYIYGLISGGTSQGSTALCFGSVENPIKVMMHEHNQEGERFRKIKELTNGYMLPEDACNTYRLALVGLKVFQEHLHEHIHIENNIIFPQAIFLEKSAV